MILLNVDYIDDSDLAAKASCFLQDNGVRSIPVDIESLIERNYHMDIVPLPSLQAAFDMDGYLAPDFSAIYVDESIYSASHPHRYRFTLAHELGHRILHERYLGKLKFSSVGEWAQIVNQIDPSDHGKMEYQAYAFAGLVLVPRTILETEFNQELTALRPQIEHAQEEGISRELYVNTVLDQIACGLSRRFEVSTEVLDRRIKADSLAGLIP